MRIMSPFDLLNMFDDMKPGERRVYHLGSIRYDRGEVRGASINLKLWKLAATARFLEREKLAILYLRRLGDFKYEYYIQKRSEVNDIPDWISDEVEKLEHRRDIGGMI